MSRVARTVQSDKKSVLVARSVQLADDICICALFPGKYDAKSDLVFFESYNMELF